MLRPLHRYSIAALASALLLIAPLAGAAPVDINADHISRTADGVVRASGHVIITREFDTLSADKVSYRSKEHVLQASGHVVIISRKAKIEADKATMHTASKAGHMDNAVITLPDGSRLKASHLKRIDAQTYEADELSYSACPVDDESWRIRARHGLLDQHSGSLTTTGSRFELAGIPVLYVPWWQQATRRKSGFLMPGFGIGKRRGTEVALPYYWAPSTSWDATLTPHWMSARGIMGELELRHRSVTGNEFIQMAGIRDSITHSNRNRLKAKIDRQLPASLYFNASVDHVSDHDYIADYATSTDLSTPYLRSSATLSQSGSYASFSGNWSLQAQHQQNTLLNSNASTLQILPRLQSQLQWTLPGNALLHLDQQSTRFDRRLGIDGWRMDLHPYIELPWELAGGGITATLSAGTHHTRYWLQNNPPATLANSIPSRSTAELSMELRSDFESINQQRTLRHVISPVVRYDFIHAPDQTGLPNFDSGFSQLTFSNLLAGNRFTGYDRIERINRFSLMLESKLQLKTENTDIARDVLIARIGTAIDMLRQRIDRTLQQRPTQALSNLLGEISWSPATGISLSGAGQYNSAANYWATISSALNLTSTDKQLHLGYIFTDKRYATPAKLINISGTYQLQQRWHASASWQYDILQKLSQQASVGLQYQHACWTIGLEAYRSNRRSGTTTSSNLGFTLLLEFKGLGSVGS